MLVFRSVEIFELSRPDLKKSGFTLLIDDFAKDSGREIFYQDGLHLIYEPVMILYEFN